MKSSKILIIHGLALFTLVSFSFRMSDPDKSAVAALSDPASEHLDGTYQGQSQASYTSEPFWGHVQITVDNSLFTDVRFMIRDSSTHEYVDSMYGVIHYTGSPEYMQQCVNEQHGIEVYPGYLINSQDLDDVDAYTGASAVWSHDIFIASAKDALKNAHKPNTTNSTQTSKVDIYVQPNPFSSILDVEYFLAEKSSVNLCIYNSDGKLVKQLVNQEQLAGYYNYRWDDSSPSGIYYCRLCADDIIYSSKIVKQ